MISLRCQYIIQICKQFAKSEFDRGIIMDTKNNVKALWEYLCDEFEPEEIEAAFEAAIEGFEYQPAEINDEMIDALSDEKAKALFLDIGYMAVNELFGGDFETWNEVLAYNLDFDRETINFLDY